MNKKHVIRKHSDFVRVAIDGCSVHAGFFVLQAKRNSGYGYSRVGFTASKRVGNAVVRNRCKRRLRALAAMLVPVDGSGVDYVFIAKARLFSADWNDVVCAAKFALQKISRRV